MLLGNLVKDLAKTNIINNLNSGNELDIVIIENLLNYKIIEKNQISMILKLSAEEKRYLLEFIDNVEILKKIIEAKNNDLELNIQEYHNDLLFQELYLACESKKL